MLPDGVGGRASMMPLEGIGEFGDARRAVRGAWLFGRIVATGSLCLRKVGGDRAGEIAAHRFLDSPQVSAEEIIATLSGALENAVVGSGSSWRRTPARSISAVERGRAVGWVRPAMAKRQGFFCTRQWRSMPPMRRLLACWTRRCGRAGPAGSAPGANGLWRRRNRNVG